MRNSRWTALAVAALVAGVFVTPVRAQEVEIKPSAKVKRDKYILTADEIAERADIANAYEAVKLLRPNFLKATRAKGSMSAGGSGAYRPKIDFTSLGGTSDPTPKGKPGESSPESYRPGEPGGTSAYGGSSGGASNSLMAVLYLDDSRQHDAKEQSAVESRLKGVLVADIVEIRYMGGTEASGRYGSGHEGGAILVKTKRLGKG